MTLTELKKAFEQDVVLGRELQQRVARASAELEQAEAARRKFENESHMRRYAVLVLQDLGVEL